MAGGRPFEAFHDQACLRHRRTKPHSQATGRIASFRSAIVTTGDFFGHWLAEHLLRLVVEDLSAQARKLRPMAAIEKVDHQADGQPDQKTEPGDDGQAGHQQKTEEDAE
jgi:hypothetical protein